MSENDPIHERTQAILDHKRQFAEQAERIRRDADLPDDERIGALRRAHWAAVNQHHRLVENLRIVSEGVGVDEGQPPPLKTLNDVIRATRDGAGVEMVEHFLTAAPERPRELAGR